MTVIQKNMRLLNEVKKYPNAELTFFEDCTNEIVKCRQVLKWAYVVEFYSVQELNRQEIELFKFQRGALEEACEQTHKLMESDLTPYLSTDAVDRGPFYKFKAELTNLTQVLKQSYRSFVEHVQLKLY